MEVVFLTVEQVMELHADSLARWGGQDGVRDQGLLESAIAQAQASFGSTYLHVFPFAMAAAYAFHIAENQPFIDGNKRTALATLFMFLHMNNRPLIDRAGLTDDLANAILRLSDRSLNKEGLAALLESWA